MKKTNKLDNSEYAAENLHDKTAIITGGTTGIGRATALLLASKGVHIIFFGRHEKELNDVMEDFRRYNLEQNVHGLIADSANKNDIEKVFNEADKIFSKLDILINNAALAYQSIQDGGYDDWQYVLDTNLLGYMACCNEAIKRMKKTDGGQIVNVGSMSADVREKGSSVYVATKSGIEGFSEALRKEVAELGIKITLIEPGAVGTDMQASTPPDEQRKKQQTMEMLKAEDIAQCILYALTQPPRCDISVVQIKPHMQEI
jgi:NADP-dependent 3-hydroxy acid dehydrogenase YdfG